MKHTVILVYNPKSGSAVSLGELKKLCLQYDIHIKRSIKINKSLPSLLKTPVSRGDTIMAIGGDGTLSFVAAQLVNSKATFIPLPGGTLNNFTKDLGIPQNIDEALGAASKSKPRMLDIAEVNNNFFLNNSSLGLYPQSLHTRKRLEDRLGKWPAAFFAVCRSLFRYRTYTVTVNKRSFKTPFVFIGNNTYKIQGLDLPRRKTLQNGNLCIFIAKTSSRLGLARIFASAIFKGIDDTKSLDFITTEAITISPKHKRKVHVSSDGELVKIRSPLEYRIHQKALRVLY